MLAAQRLEVLPADCLVVDDSPNGVRAAVAAGANVIAFGTPFTIKGLHESNVVSHDRILHEPSELLDMVRRVIEERKEKTIGSNDLKEHRLQLP